MITERRPAGREENKQMLTAEIREAQAVDVPRDDEMGDPARVVGVLAVRIHGKLEQVRPIIAAMMFAPMTAELSEDGALVLRHQK